MADGKLGKGLMSAAAAASLGLLAVPPMVRRRGSPIAAPPNSCPMPAWWFTRMRVTPRTWSALTR
jgi:hypothetical protein